MAVQTVFKTDVDVTTTTLAAAGALATGQIRYENGNQYTLYKSSGTIAAKKTVKISAYTSGELIIAVTGDNEDGIGITQAASVVNDYVWVMTMGLATGRATAAITAFATCGGMATGLLDDGSTGRAFAILLEGYAGGAEKDIDIWIL